VNPITWLILILYLGPTLWLWIATREDLNLWKNPKTRGWVVEDFPAKLPEHEIYMKFLKTNLRELSLYLVGLTAGVVMGFSWRLLVL